MVKEFPRPPPTVAPARSASPPKPEEEEVVVDATKKGGVEVDPPPCEVRCIPGKGLGLFALRPMEVGEVVIREEPLIVMPDAVFALVSATSFFFFFIQYISSKASTSSCLA